MPGATVQLVKSSPDSTGCSGAALGLTARLAGDTASCLGDVPRLTEQKHGLIFFLPLEAVSMLSSHSPMENELHSHQLVMNHLTGSLKELLFSIEVLCLPTRPSIGSKFYQVIREWERTHWPLVIVCA